MKDLKIIKIPICTHIYCTYIHYSLYYLSFIYTHGGCSLHIHLTQVLQQMPFLTQPTPSAPLACLWSLWTVWGVAATSLR